MKPQFNYQLNACPKCGQSNQIRAQVFTARKNSAFGYEAVSVCPCCKHVGPRTDWHLMADVELIEDVVRLWNSNKNIDMDSIRVMTQEQASKYVQNYYKQKTDNSNVIDVYERKNNVGSVKFETPLWFYAFIISVLTFPPLIVIFLFGKSFISFIFAICVLCCCGKLSNVFIRNFYGDNDECKSN